MLRPFVLVFLHVFFGRSEDAVCVLQKRRAQQLSEHIAAGYLAKQDLEHQYRNSYIDYAIAVPEYEWNYERVCNNCRQRYQSAVFAEHVSEDCSDQCGDASEYNIEHDAPSDEVGDQAADEQSRDRCRCEHWQNAQCFSYSHLYRTEGYRCKNQCENHIKSSDNCALSDSQNFWISVFH